ncbi:MAG: translation initiation factor IF-2 [Oscillospiraceae bacterium]|jgi:translation initiation factor IF-2|nr:translation initiation factor IF-2 [Oscillospiraceae bacterium]
MPIKYKLQDFAKDFGLTTKDVITILGEYSTAPKNQQATLREPDLNILFEYLTQAQQDTAEAIGEVLALSLKPSPPKPEPVLPTPEEVAAAKAAKAAASREKAKAKDKEKDKDKEPKDGKEAKEGEVKPKTNAQRKLDRFANPAPAPQSGKKAKQTKEQATHSSTRGQTLQRNVPTAQGGVTIEQSKQDTNSRKRVVDTRGATVNLDKYDERIESLAGDAGGDRQGGKQKIIRKKEEKNQRPLTMAQGAKRRQEQRAQMQKLQLETARKQIMTVSIPDEISVGDLALRMKQSAAEVIKQLIKLGQFLSVSDIVDYDTAAVIALDLGCKVEHEVKLTIEEQLFDEHVDRPEELIRRNPVVVVMGHVDHGKTSLLDNIRKAKVAEGEAGGITQHIGAYQVDVKDQALTFLDTPGHEAFTSMRARGANITDLAILVVAADDGIMPQTIEAINHAKAAEIPIVVAINKIDKAGANPERIKQQLTEYGLVPEEWGGDTIICPISAKYGDGVDALLEMVLLAAEMRELRANPNRAAKGTVIEARLDKSRGAIATLLVQNGTLKPGDVIIAGTAVGRVRTMNGSHGIVLTEAGPSVPVEITGLSEVPGAGEAFASVDNERMARELAEQRKFNSKVSGKQPERKISLDDLFSQIKQGEIKELPIIIKADVHGSAEAVRASLEKLEHPEVRVKVIHCGVGAPAESDVMLAVSSNAIIVGFNVRPDGATLESVQRQGVDLRLYRVIYECIEEIEAAMKGLLAPKFKEVVLGHAEIRQVISVSKVGKVAGCYVLDGVMRRGTSVRVVRDGSIVHDGELASLKRFKDDVREVATGYECGLSIERFNDIKESDIVEAYTMEQIENS